MWHQLPCSFCYKRLDEAKLCLLALSPEDVAHRAGEILARSAQIRDETVAEEPVMD